MPPTIRRATLKDVPAILAIERQAPTAGHWEAGEYEKLLQSGVILVAEEAGNVRGFVCSKNVADDLEIENVVVATEFLRQGIADRLMRSLIEQTEKQAASRIWLEVRESNQAARSLYEKHGFHEVGRRRKYYKNPVEDAILYERRGEPANQT